MERKEKFKECFEKYVNAESALFKECKTYLRKVLKENNGYIYWERKEGEDYLDDFEFVPSLKNESGMKTIIGVKAVGRDIVLIFEDKSEDYMCEIINADDYYNLCEFLCDNAEILGIKV